VNTTSLGQNIHWKKKKTNMKDDFFYSWYKDCKVVTLLLYYIISSGLWLHH